MRYGATSAEEKSKVFRRSIYITRDLKAGDMLSDDNIRIIRPGFGLPPVEFDRVKGKRLRRDAARGTALTWDLIS